MGILEETDNSRRFPYNKEVSSMVFICKGNPSGTSNSCLSKQPYSLVTTAVYTPAGTIKGDCGGKWIFSLIVSLYGASTPVRESIVIEPSSAPLHEGAKTSYSAMISGSGTTINSSVTTLSH